MEEPSPAGVPVYVFVEVSSYGGGDVEVAGRVPDSYPVVRKVEAGSPVSLEALPAEGYYFVGWGGDLYGNENPTELELDDDAEIVAYFFPEEIVSNDNGLQIDFPVGTVVQNKDGEPLLGLDIAIVETLPPPPPQAYIIGVPYELGPYGATFDQPASLSLSYDPALIPERVLEEDLDVGYYDDESAQWLLLPSVVDVTNHIVTAPVEHLSTFGVISPEPPPLPAVFDAGELSFYPPEVEIGELIVVSVLVTNSGEAEGVYTLTLTIDGVVVATKEVVMAGGSQRVAFSTYEDEAGTYSVEVNGLEGSFTVREAPLLPIVLPRAVIWVILGLAIAVMVAAAFISPFVPMRRDY